LVAGTRRSPAKLRHGRAVQRPRPLAREGSNAFFTAFGRDCKKRPGNRFGKGNGIFL